MTLWWSMSKLVSYLPYYHDIVTCVFDVDTQKITKLNFVVKTRKRSIRCDDFLDCALVINKPPTNRTLKAVFDKGSANNSGSAV